MPSDTTMHLSSRAATELLSALFRSATELAIIATDPDGLIVAFNSGAERLLGYAADDVVCRVTPEQFHDSDEVSARAVELGAAPGFDVFVHAARRGEVETRRWTYVARDGRRVPVELTVTPLEDTLGDVTGFMSVATDLTSRLEAEGRQTAALAYERDVVAKLRELDSVKADFVSTVSHELRTPLTSIIGFTELLLDEEAMTGERRSSLEIVDRNAQRLLALVDELLTLSGIGSGKFELCRTRFAMVDAVNAAVETVRPMAQASELSLTVTIDSANLDVTGLDIASVEIDGDRAQIERVLLNLLSNAIKATSTGGVVVVRVAVDGAEVVVSVSDTGVGIPADEIDGLFTRFFRTSTARHHAIQGTGLGLSIVRSVVDHHDGSVSVDSVEGLGTTFVVRLPLTQDRPDAGSQPSAVLLPPLQEVHP